MNKILIIGANGQLGTALQNEFPKALTTDVKTLDITNEKSVNAYPWKNVDIIINAAAFTNVDGAETPQGRISAWQVNATAVANLAKIATTHNIILVHISSDYVFDGSKKNYNEAASFSPLSVYGASKAAGDLSASVTPKHYIIRTSWVIGNGNNFVRTIHDLAQKNIKPSVVNDQVGRLTFTPDLAAAIKHLIKTEQPFGIYNFTNSGPSKSWAEIAKEVYDLSGKNPDDVTPVSTKEYNQGKTGIAPRPQNSTLDLTKIENTGFTVLDWQDRLRSYLQQ